MVRVRFAPSPTGNLHVGGARTALFNYLFAKAMGGQFLLRIEDTDRTRYSAEAEVALQKELHWLGLSWDEGPGVGGDCGPYKQSERLDLYKQYAYQLVEDGKAYFCFCTSERLDELRKKQTEDKSFSGYDRHCRSIDAAEAKKRADSGERFVIRLKVPIEGGTVFTDLIRGPIEFKHSELDDIVLYKSNGFPSYHLANVVDDHFMQITHVMRGEEWIPSTPKHVLLYKAFGWDIPKFAHLPVILSPNGGKLSKRDGAASVGEYRDNGYLPHALNNFLALLGWNPGDDTELMSMAELCSRFSIERIQPKSCAFDTRKLDWMNKQYMTQMPAQSWLAPLKQGLIGLSVNIEAISDEYMYSVIALMKSRVDKLDEIAEKSLYFFKDPDHYDEKGIKKVFEVDGVVSVLTELARELNALQDWSQKSLENLFHHLAEQLSNGNLGAFVHPCRLAISGVTGGPGLFEMLAVLPKDAVVRRLSLAKIWLEQKA